jgi:zinc and cadmium transporter
MQVLINILFFTFLGSVASLIGGVILLSREKFATRISHYLTAFAAGTLLGTAFFDLLPEAQKQARQTDLFFWVLTGMLFFFLLEQIFHWFHHHQHGHGEEISKSAVPLMLLGDSVHNFIDGIVIAATFLVSAPLGVVTALAVGAHEIPQEIGDFAILLHAGIKPKKVLLFNFLSACVSFAGALTTYFLADLARGLLPIFLSVTAGFFIYIASSDLIPEINSEQKKKSSLLKTLTLFSGVFIIWIFLFLLEK